MNRPSRSPALQALKDERNGRRTCIACDAPLGGRRSVLCGDLDCRRLYLSQVNGPSYARASGGGR